MLTYRALKALRYAGVSYAKGNTIGVKVKPRDARALVAARVLVAVEAQPDKKPEQSVEPVAEAPIEPAKLEPVAPAVEAQPDKKRGRYERRDMRAKP